MIHMPATKGRERTHWLCVFGFTGLLLAACGGPDTTPASTLGPMPPVTKTSVANATPILTTTTIPSGTSDVDISYDRRTPFVPLDNPALLSGREANYLRDDDLVLGLEWENVTHAYPIRMLRFHHIVNDTIGGRPFLITY